VLRHVALLTWVDGATEEQVAAVTAGLRALEDRVPGLRGYRVGPDLGLAPGNHQYAIVADFDSIEDFLTYRDHPAHRAVLAERIRPILATRAAVQYEHG
jgi:hypothetical protein